MDEQERHGREMNLNAHFAWALAMWGSADVAREEGLLLPASIGYYYSGFHACFALVNTNPTIPLSALKRIGHTKLEGWIEEMGVGMLQFWFKELRGVRETVNYLGLGDPAHKLKTVRGGGLVFGMLDGNKPFREAIDHTRVLSLRVLTKALSFIETWAKANKVMSPKKGEPNGNWLNEYMQEDFLASILPLDDDMRRRVLKRTCFPLTLEAAAEATLRQLANNPGSSDEVEAVNNGCK
ncbi:MAG: hypothetical protein K1X57_18320 [Gemmataceae bacterium]|nr:hypothetical protein [Gemmataceae bacterium]